MAARSIATLTLSFGLVSIPVKLYSATESSSAVSFKMLTKKGGRVKQQYVDDEGAVVERGDMIKGYEFEKDQFVLFQPDELKKLEEAASHAVEIVSFVPEKSVDPLYYDKPYFLAPDKRGGKPYTLLMKAMADTGRCALAQWATRGKAYVVQVRVTDGGLVLQQLLYANEVRSIKDLGIEVEDVKDAELALARQLIDQIAQDSYDPTQFKDMERERILAAIDDKIAGKQVVESTRDEDATTGGQVIDLMAALQASLNGKKGGAAAAKTAAAPEATKARKTPKRAAVVEEPAVAAPKVRARK
jgi:DNA end-binding protein Ku